MSDKYNERNKTIISRVKIPRKSIANKITNKRSDSSIINIAAKDTNQLNSCWYIALQQVH